MQLKKVTREQINEWLDSPVTKAFRDECESTRDEIESGRGLNAYHPYEPQKSQEVLANLNGAWDTWDEVVDCLTDAELLMEPDDEHIGD